MKAVILAAGRGTRLGKHTEDKPKSLLPLGDKTLLQRSVENIQAAGFSKVTIVVGYRHEMIEDLLKKHFSPTFYQTVMNPDYTRGSGSSLMCTAPEFQGEVVIIESDLLYHVEVLRRMASPTLKNAMAMGFFNHNRREVKLYLKDQSKAIAKAQWGEPDDKVANGDWVGFTRLSAEASQSLQSMLQKAQTQAGQELHYESFIFRLVEQFQFEAVPIQDLPWVEIDNDIDLHKAETEICPKIDCRKK